MEETKYGKYICTELKKNISLPVYRRGGQPIGEGDLEGSRRRMEHVIWMDSEVIPGAFYAECVWIWPWGKSSSSGVPPHTHPFDEVLAYFGTNLEDPHDLGGEVELWLEDEQFILNKSFIAYIPAGMKHCPLKTLRVDRPMFHFTLGPGQKYR
jgi:hypothetical protein